MMRDFRGETRSNLLIGRVGTVAAMRRSHLDAISPRATPLLFDEPWGFRRQSRQSNLKTHCGIHSDWRSVNC